MTPASGQNQKPISGWLIALLLLIAGAAAWFLIPTRSDLLERQIRDQSPDRALKTLSQLSEKDRSKRPDFYALMELQLRRQTVGKTNAVELMALLKKAAAEYARFGYPQTFLTELLALVDLQEFPAAAEQALGQQLSGMPVIGRRLIYEKLSQKALSQAKPQEAAALYDRFYAAIPPQEPATVEMVRLWRLAGTATNALAAIEVFATRSNENIQKLSPKLARTRIDLLRETSRADLAFEAVRDLRAVQDSPELYALFVTTARESNRAAEILPEMRKRAAATKKAEDWSSVAELAMAVNRIDWAIEASEEVAKLDPNDPAVRFKLGQFYEWSGKPSEGFDEYLKALKLGDHRALGRLLALNPGLYRDTELLEALKQVESKLIDNPYVLDLARLEARLGQFESAVRRYKALIKKTGLTEELTEEYGRLLLDLFEYPAAKALFAEALQNLPQNKIVRRGLAEALFRVGDFKSSLDQYEVLVDQQADAASVENYITLAETLGRMHNVIAGLRRQIQTADATSREYQRLAYFEHLQGRDQAMREVLVQGANRFPEDETLVMKAAYALGDAKHYVEAAELMKNHRELRKNPEIVRYYVGLLVQSQKYKEAQAFLENSVEKSLLERPGLAEVLAQIAEANSKPRDALEIFGRLRKLDPSNVRYTMNYARLLSTQGRMKEAEVVIRPHLTHPTAEILKLAAQVYAEMGQYKTAEEYQRQYLATAPVERGEAWGFLGDVLLSRGDKVNAHRAYEQGLNEALKTAAKNLK
jgi:predicted Zn-dependent protease